MSFKIKKWAGYRTVHLTDYVPGLKAKGATSDEYGFAYPWQDRIIIGCYDADDAAVWCMYYPDFDMVDGPFAGPGYSWVHSSTPWDTDCHLCYWGDDYFMGCPGSGASGMIGSDKFYGWDRGCAFWQWDMAGLGPVSGEPRKWVLPSINIGSSGSLPSLMVASQYQDGPGGPWLNEWGIVNYGGSYAPLRTDPDLYIPFHDGWFIDWQQLGSMVAGTYIDGSSFPSGVWGIPPLEGSEDGGAGSYTYGKQLLVGDPTSMGLGLFSGEAWVENNQLGWTPVSSPLSGGERPWQSRWEYYQNIHGGYLLDDRDLDGQDHVVGYHPIKDLPVSTAGGWYYAVDNNTPIDFTVWVMNPYQPPSKSHVTARINGTLGWVGDYGIGDNQKLEHLTPFPDERAPQGGGVQAPQERRDGLLVGRKEIFRGSGASLKYVRDVSIDLSDYDHGENWWFPGEAGTRYPGFWDIFAGPGPTVLGYMPDQDFGLLDPTARNCSRGLGQTEENLIAVEPGATHIVRESDMVTNTLSWATPLTSTLYGPRHQLVSAMDGTRFAYTANGLQFQSMPYWAAKVGKIAGKEWTTTFDLEEIGPPGLGETGWTVWSVIPIPRLLAMPRGGWLVGATLYFAPWGDSWEWTPGTRDATFMETGQGWVPAKPGWVGPLNTDLHQPVYLTALDEWSVGRSLYGPDALLVYDDAGAFVKCLNSTAIYPPDGREIMVTESANPQLIYRVYCHGTYSDFAEGEGLFHKLTTNEEVQAPLYATYDLCQGSVLGPGAFRGFVDMYAVGVYAPQNAAWRWSVANSLYSVDYPKTQWSPPGPSYVRSGKGGRGITPLTPGPSTSQSGIHGVGKNAMR